MWEVKMIDKSNNIIGLKWSGHVKKEEVDQANEKIEQLINELNSESFDMLIEMENLLAFPKNTQEKIIEQQKWVIKKGMRRAAVVVDKATTRMQLKNTSKESNNTNEHFFANYEEALAFLKNS